MLSGSAKRSHDNRAYDDLRETLSLLVGRQPSDPKTTRSAILTIVDADKPPLRIFFGKTPLKVATQDDESRLAVWNGQYVSAATYGA